MRHANALQFVPLVVAALVAVGCKKDAPSPLRVGSSILVPVMDLEDTDESFVFGDGIEFPLRSSGLVKLGVRRIVIDRTDPRTDRMLGSTSYGLDEEGRLVRVVDDFEAIHYQWDDNRLVSKRIERGGKLASEEQWTYRIEGGKVMSVEWVMPRPARELERTLVKYSYSGRVRRAEWLGLNAPYAETDERAANGALVAWTKESENGIQKRTYRYRDGRLVSEQVGGDFAAFTTEYRYDPKGRLVERLTPDLYQQTYRTTIRYDRRGLPVAIRDDTEPHDRLDDPMTFEAHYSYEFIEDEPGGAR